MTTAENAVSTGQSGDGPEEKAATSTWSARNILLLAIVGLAGALCGWLCSTFLYLLIQSFVDGDPAYGSWLIGLLGILASLFALWPITLSAGDRKASKASSGSVFVVGAIVISNSLTTGELNIFFAIWGAFAGCFAAICVARFGAVGSLVRRWKKEKPSVGPVPFWRVSMVTGIALCVAYAAEGLGRRSITNAGVELSEGKDVKHDFDRAAILFKIAARAGDPQADYNLGVCYLNGQGVAQDYSQASDLFRHAADAGISNAVFALGKMAWEGKGQAPDPVQAVVLFRKCADDGNGDAMLALAIAYSQGKGVGQDTQQAIDWLRKGADSGSLSAMCALGLGYATGDGLSQDSQQAIFWTKKAANAGSSEAMYQLGQFYESGLPGIPASETDANAWYRRSANAGNADAAQRLSHGPPIGNSR